MEQRRNQSINLVIVKIIFFLNLVLPLSQVADQKKLHEHNKGSVFSHSAIDELYEARIEDLEKEFSGGNYKG